MGPRKHVLDDGAHWHSLADTMESSTYGVDAAFLSNSFDHLLLLVAVLTDAAAGGVVRSNPLGARGNIAQRYGELVKDLWSGTARSIAPLKLRVNIIRHMTLCALS